MHASALLAFFPFWMLSEYRSLPELFAAIHRRRAHGQSLGAGQTSRCIPGQRSGG